MALARRAAAVALAVAALVPAVADAASDHFAGLVGVAPPPVECAPAPCAFVDGNGDEQRLLANSDIYVVRISPHVVKVNETFTLTFSNPDVPDSTSGNCSNVVAFASLQSTAHPSADTQVCTFKATGATNFNEPGVGTGVGYNTTDYTSPGSGDEDYYAITQNQFELAGKIVRGGGPPLTQVLIEIKGGSPETTTMVKTNTEGLYSTVLPAGTYTVTPQADGSVPVSRSVALSAHRRDVDFELAAEFVVNQQQDGLDTSIGDGVCDVDGATAGQQCSLRAAINEANAGKGDKITFDLTGTPDVVVSDDPLPPITRSVEIDGTGNASGRPAIVRGDDFNTDHGKAVARHGLLIKAGPTIVRHLNVRGFGDQVVVDSPGRVELRDVFLGTDRAGTSPAPEAIPGFTSFCNEAVANTFEGDSDKVFGAGVRASTAQGLVIDASVINFNPGCGVVLALGVTGAQITQSELSVTPDGVQRLEGQPEDIVGEADGVTISGVRAGAVTAGHTLNQAPGGAPPSDSATAHAWEIVTSVVGKLEVNGNDHRIGRPGLGNQIGTRVFITGDRNTLQGNTIDFSSSRTGDAFAVIVRGAGNRIGGPDRLTEGNEINGGGQGRHFQPADLLLGENNEILGDLNGVKIGLGGVLVRCPTQSCADSALPSEADRGRGNVIEGNNIFDSLGKGGVVIEAPDTTVRGNRIERSDFAGVWVDGAKALVERNSITGVRLGPGVYVNSGTGHRILTNFLANLTGIGIDLGDGKTYLGGQGPTPNDRFDADSGANDFQNSPEIETAELTAEGALHLKTNVVIVKVDPGTPTFQFFSVPNCLASKAEAQGLVAEASPQLPSGNILRTIEFTLPEPSSPDLGPIRAGMGIVATVTPDFGTSELSTCVTVVTAPPGCKLKPRGDAATLSVRVGCDTDAELTLGGEARIAPLKGGKGASASRTEKRKVRKVKLRRVKKRVKAGKQATIKVRLPKKVKAAVQRGQRVSLMLKVTANAGGEKSTFKAKVRRLKPHKRSRRGR